MLLQNKRKNTITFWYYRWCYTIFYHVLISIIHLKFAVMVYLKWTLSLSCFYQRYFVDKPLHSACPAWFTEINHCLNLNKRKKESNSNIATYSTLKYPIPLLKRNETVCGPATDWPFQMYQLIFMVQRILKHSYASGRTIRTYKISLTIRLLTVVHGLPATFVV